jgi:hypothetical protein
MIPYTEYQYLWPPRPEKAFPPAQIGYYERLGHVAQIKMNGTSTVIFVSPDKKMIFKTRHNADHKAWLQPNGVLPIMNKIGAGWYVFVAELLHSKVPGIRDTFYFHEMLVEDSQYLVDTTFSNRQDRMYNLFMGDRAYDSTLSHFILDEHTWLARNHTVGFSQLFTKLDRPEYEGLVLKDPDARLNVCSRATSNTGWQIKARCAKGRMNYAF